eukprot:TRINITY_DN2357_c0_g2_i1.p1 TRINITY_DN2357_c0_g2~~TRINITY_DN2357_c0_g2_i1.p1  ORF type:complete len:419 (+),score=88.20 TRINITY_DN2357_c0_g2_i1:101-1357(+)
MGRPTSTEQKLDMSLDDLVKKERNEGYGPAGRDKRGGDRERPYSEGDGQDRGKGKPGKRRLPPEEKAWLHTHCFFKSESEFVVKLYDTEILQLRKSKQDLQANTGNAGTQREQSGDKKSDGKTSDDKQSDDKSEDKKSDDKKTDDAKPNDAKPDDAKPDDAKPDDAKPDNAKPDDGKPGDNKPDDKAADTKPAGGLVLVMTSGGFRTAETRIILNEALKPMALRIDGSDSSRWTLISEYKTPGEVTGASTTKPFEDGMEFRVPSLVTLESVRDHMAERQKAARAAGDRPRGRGQPMPPPGSSAGLPPLQPPPRGWPPPPHAWGMPPPPGWRPPLYPHAPPGMHPPPPWGAHMPPPGPWAGGYRPPYPHPYGPPRPPPHGFPAPPGAAPAVPPGVRPPQQAVTTGPSAPAGPVSDDMFQ